MKHLIDKDALVSEINRLKKKNDAYDKPSHIADVCYKEILSLIDTLEVKEVDLDREMQAFASLYLEPLKISDSNIGISITMAQLYSCAKHFFELGISVSNKAQKGGEV